MSLSVEWAECPTCRVSEVIDRMVPCDFCGSYYHEFCEIERCDACGTPCCIYCLAGERLCPAEDPQ